ncbi:MAG: DUF5112 domain-containing protein, partial [Reichenbachiella sp.]
MNNIFWCVLSLSITLNFASFSQEIFDVDLLNEKSTQMRDVNLDSVFIYANQAFEISQKINYTNGEVNALTNICFSCYAKGDYTTALENCQKAISIHTKSKSIADISNTYLFLGLIHVAQKNYDQGINQFIKLIEVASNLNNDYLLSDAFSNMALAYMSLGNFDKAKQYYQLSTEVHKNIIHPHGEVYVTLNMGQIHFDQQSYDSAVYYLKESGEIAVAINNPRVQFYAYSLLGQTPTIPSTEAQYYLDSALSIAQSIGWDTEILNTRTFLTRLHMQENNIDPALTHALEALDYSLKLKDYKKTQEIYQVLVRIYTIKEDISTAHIYISDYGILTDSLNNSKKGKLITSILGVDELLAEEREYDKMKISLEAAQLRITQKNTIIFASILGFILVLAIFLVSSRVYRVKLKNAAKLNLLNEKLDASIKEKDLLLGMIVHDLRSPLNKVYGLTEVLKLSEGNIENAETINMIQTIINNSKSLTDELLEINQLDAKSKSIKDEEIHIKTFIQDIVFHFSTKAKEKNIQMKTDFSL